MFKTTHCDASVPDGVSRWTGDTLYRTCLRPARFLFAGTVDRGRDGSLPGRQNRVFLCKQHSGPGYLSELALPGWVESVTDLRAAAK
jgi:hypothetical protein